MRPVRLELRNFLAYRTPDPISFDGLDVVCLSGPNGAGKSSLLDAITWALWKRTRAKLDDELIHMGQDEMFVIFDFAQDGTPYRVVRKHSKKGRISHSSLDFYTWDVPTNQYRLMNGSSSRETQENISRILKLDYDTFIHSAFVQQGKADLFTLETPARRKKILADILGLSRWEVYEERAKRCLQGISEELTLVDASIAEKAAEEARQPALEVEREQASRQHESALAELATAENRHEEVAGAPAQRQSTEKQLAAVVARIRELEGDLAAVDSELEHQQARLENYRQTIGNRQDIEDGYARLDQARQMFSDLSDRLAQQADAQERLHEMERQLDAARAELENRQNLHADHIHTAEQDITAGDSVSEELAELENELAHLEARKAERETMQKQQNDLARESGTLEAHNKALHAEMTTIKERITLLESAQTAECPACGQPLSDEHRAGVIAQYQADGKQRGDAFRENKGRLKEIDAEAATCKNALRQIELDLRRYDELNKRAGGLRQRVATAQQAQSQLESEQAARDSVQWMLAEEDFSHELRAQIAAQKAEIEGLGYDRAVHSEARDALATLATYETRKRALDIALESIAAVESSIEATAARRERILVRLEEERLSEGQFRQDLAELDVLVLEAQKRQAEARRARQAERDAYERVIYVQQQLSSIEGARRRRLELEARAEQLREDESVYLQLREAFGKNGIPAMVIEAAIPELEETANRLLGRITDGRMNVRLDTQREKKTGGTIETLDILISDELGTRNYDMFSGGEGFRVNFVLRIALSEFLARRAGARLQTLVFDEGFGSQDAVGRERLVEAIRAIQSDFDLVLIVTHIDELRDQFERHIEVRKTADRGSVVTVR